MKSAQKVINNESVNDQVFQLWADSFHEGDWACREIAKIVQKNGGKFEVEYLNGFIPRFKYELNKTSFEIYVFGNYHNWEPRPSSLSKLLEWGKPDLVLIRDSDSEILIAIEETAATPTGNQALQRCERQFGAAIEGFPFWYLISEFGTHSDGGVRRDSIWPTLMGLEIMTALEVPSIVLHYSDLTNPEDYSMGSGVESLFEVFLGVVINSISKLPAMTGLEEIMTKQLNEMINFINATWENSLYFLPVIKNVDVRDLSNKICLKGDLRHLTQSKRKNLLDWPLVTGLTISELETQVSRTLKKHDDFAYLLEESIANGKAYGVIKGSGSKPQNMQSMQNWISQQTSIQIKWENENDKINHKNKFRLNLQDFPPSETGVHVITAPRILYLFDEFSEVIELLGKAFPRLDQKIQVNNASALVYISNSVKPGRIFGDPYTGQISSYAVSFGALSHKRKVVCYFPHQSIAQAANNLHNPNNKGLRILRELTDLLVFGGGYAIKTKTLEVI